ncbi:MAG: histone deacetylase [Gemmatimonadota bacterium]
MEKYALLRERVMKIPEVTLRVPEPAPDPALLHVHTADYLTRVREGTLSRDQARRIGFPWSPQLVERSRRSVGGTIEAARVARIEGTAANLAGGTHHAYADRGEGFCVFNDVAVSIGDVHDREPSLDVAVLDLDVHQGNGTAKIFEDDPRVRTVSVHGEKNYPFHKERSDVDIGLEDGTTDADFLSAVREGVDAALAGGAELLYYVAGADAFEGDRLGRLSVTKDGLAERDDLVFDAAERAGASIVVVMAGGYATPIEHTVDIHAATVARAAASRPTQLLRT